MKKYSLIIVNGVRFNDSVIAKGFESRNGSFYFTKESNQVVAVYPVNCTIIYKIEDYEEI